MKSRIDLIAGLCLTLLSLLGGCRGDVGEICTEDEDCKRGLICYATQVWLNPGGALQCARECPCEEGEQCLYSTICARSCESDDDCPPGTLCNGPDGAECAVICEEDSDCERYEGLSCPVPGELCQ